MHCKRTICANTPVKKKMNDSPLLSKMDALLRKHRGGVGDDDAPPKPASTAVPPPGAWLPVLTDVIERGVSPVDPVPAERPVPRAEAKTPVDGTPASPMVSDALAEQLMSELAPRLSEAMEKQVAAELRKNLDQTVISLLSQLDTDVREIVRDAIAEKLKQPRDPPT